MMFRPHQYDETFWAIARFLAAHWLCWSHKILIRTVDEGCAGAVEVSHWDEGWKKNDFTQWNQGWNSKDW